MSSKKITISILILFLMLNITSISLAQSVDELKQNIDNHNNKIEKLEKEIKIYEKEIQTVEGEAKTLQSAVQVLDINQKKIGTEIKKTETNIKKTNLTISGLGGEIGEIETKIESNTTAIIKALNDMRQKDEESLIENFLTNKSIAEVLDEYESISQFQQKVRDQSKELALYKKELSDKKIITEEERFEKELFEFESKLKIAIDPKSYPSSGKGIFSWPLDNVFITQYFGKTIDSARLYKSGTHNGIDFRASRGTPVKATLDGTVVGIGNTDAQNGCYSYGKWILISHPNGLSTLYAHLDLIKVSQGQSVQTGNIIGYSGNTGYSTGPHLHITVYASQGVKVQK